MLYPLQILVIHSSLLHQDREYEQCHRLLEYSTDIYDIYFSIILFNTFTDNIANFVGSNGYRRSFFILF